MFTLNPTPPEALHNALEKTSKQMTPTVFCSLSFSSSYFSETRFLIYSLFIRFSCARRSDLRFKFKRLCCPYRFIFSPKEDLILLALASSFGIHSAPSISHQVPLRHVNRMVHLHKLLRAEKKHTQKIFSSRDEIFAQRLQQQAMLCENCGRKDQSKRLKSDEKLLHHQAINIISKFKIHNKKKQDAQETRCLGGA